MDARLQATEQRGEGTWNTSKELPKWRQCISLLYVQGRIQRWDAPSSQPLLVQIPGIIFIYCTQMPSLPILNLEPWPNLDLAIMLWFHFFCISELKYPFNECLSCLRTYWIHWRFDQQLFDCFVLNMYIYIHI
jgi:hypothetical protein